MIVEAFAEVRGEAVVDRAAVGVVGIHIAEGDAAGESAVIAGVGETVRRQYQGQYCCHARSRSRVRQIRQRERGIYRRRPEEVGQCGRDPGLSARINTARRSTGSNPQRPSDRGVGSGISERHQIVVHYQIAPGGVRIDGAIQMASAIEVVREIQIEAAAEIAFDAQVYLLGVRVHKILSLRIAEGLED